MPPGSFRKFRNGYYSVSLQQVDPELLGLGTSFFVFFFWAWRGVAGILQQQSAPHSTFIRSWAALDDRLTCSFCGVAKNPALGHVSWPPFPENCDLPKAWCPEQDNSRMNVFSLRSQKCEEWCKKGEILSHKVQDRRYDFAFIPCHHFFSRILARNKTISADVGCFRRDV